jgi:hypothetical protein
MQAASGMSQMRLALQRVFRGDKTRRTRFHTADGQLILSGDLAKSALTTAGRIFLRRYSDLPWITYPAIRYLDHRLSGRRLFEFGAGSSTKWYADRCESVFSVENNPEWYRSVLAATHASKNVTLQFAQTDAEVREAIAIPGGLFSAIVIDCRSTTASTAELLAPSERLRAECLRFSLQYATPDCLFIIDNTDSLATLRRETESIFPGNRLLRFPGWVPGILHPNETIVAVNDKKNAGGGEFPPPAH